jgi:predicted nucleotidyltransferase
MKNDISHLRSLPSVFQKSIKNAMAKIPMAYPDTLSLILIGSVAEGDYKPDSDIDIVWVKRRKLGFSRLYEFKRELDDRIQLIPFNRKQLEEHFRNSNTMAHAIQKGIVLYINEDSISKIVNRKIVLPDRKWMKKWFEHWVRFYRMGLKDIRRNKSWHKKHCRKDCMCEVGDYLARATVNFAILFCELHGFVPTTKGKVLKGFQKFGRDDLMSGMQIALRVSRQDRFMSGKEAEKVKLTAVWLRNTLARRLRS